MAFSRPLKNGKKRYYARFRDQSGAWQDERCDGTKRDAERLEAQRKAEVKAGTYQKGRQSGALTVEIYAREWLSKRRNKTKGDDSQRIRDYVIPAMGKRRLDSLRSVECIEFVRGLVAKGINPKTVSNIWGALRTLLRDAQIAELISFAPTMPRGIIPARQSEIHEVYADWDVLSLIELGRSEMDVFCVLAFYTGMREGEICGLRWGDYEESDDPKRLGSLTVRRQYAGLGDDATTKTGRARLVPVHPSLAAALEFWRFECSKTWTYDRPIVPLRLGEHHTKSTAYKAFRRHCEAAGVASLGIHRTRHTAITAMRRGGAPADVVERITHNSRGTIVDRYTHDWTILCAGVSCIDYSGRGESRVGRAELPSSTSIVPGSIPGASTGQEENPRDSSGQVGNPDVPNISGIPLLSTRRGALRESEGSGRDDEATRLLRELVAAIEAEGVHIHSDSLAKVSRVARARQDASDYLSTPPPAEGRSA